ncbi:MAG: LysM peptidoglycan-binding domain-containing protein, partial [Caldilineaceae bacterium]|nr:LysM peptidoglycan-binding domain-containing protein [Caldilineaceae bacterium]
IFYGHSGRLLKVGALNVMDRYQPDGNIEVFSSMDIVGDLVPGVKVLLNYQILPGQRDTVQGISLRVISDGPVEIVEGASPAEDGAAAPAIEALTDACTIVAPEDWVEYEVKVGDNLTNLSMRGSTTIDEVMAANCLDRTTILIGELLYVPADTVENELRAGFCAAAIPEGWVEYEIQLGDSLSVLADRGGVTIQDLMDTNCMSDTTIILGATLIVPAEVSE